MALACALFWASPTSASAGEQPADSGTHTAGTGTSPDPSNANWAYRPGQGLRLGNSGLVLGGYATADIERFHGEQTYSQGTSNLFVFYTPLPSLQPNVSLFADLEIPDAALERGHFEISASDALNLRVGKLLTPFGRWNTQHIEPLVWTTSEPLLVESIFDDTVSGAMLTGSLFPDGGALTYSAYASLFDPINADPDEAFAEQLVGGRLEWADLDGWTVGASWLGSRIGPGTWNHLAGVDLLWQPHPRVELSGELLAGEGSRSPAMLSGGYLQAAVETLPGLHLVARYERVAPAEDTVGSIDLYDVGLAWVPLHYLRLKVDYLSVSRVVEPAEPGLRASISFLF